MVEGSALEMVDQTVRFVHLKIQQSCGFISVQKSEYFAVLPCCSVLSIFQNFRLNIWRVVRVVEGAALEIFLDFGNLSFQEWLWTAGLRRRLASKDGPFLRACLMGSRFSPF